MRRISAVQLSLFLLTLFLALFIAIFAYVVAGGVRDTQKRFEDRSDAAAQVVSSNAYWIAEVANQTLRRVDAALGPDLIGSAQQLAPALEGLPAVTEVYIIDEGANTIYATVPDAAQVSVSDREYFTALRDGAAFYTSPMIISRLTGDRIFVFSKRILRNGQFAGAIMVSFSQEVIESLWRTLDLEEGSTISLVRADGELMARFPPADAPIDLADTEWFKAIAAGNGAGTITSSVSPVDGLSRVVSYRVVPDSDLIALAAIASGPGWANFNRAVYLVALIASPILVALLLGGWWIISLLMRDAKRAAELEQQAKDLRASVELNTTLFREIHHRVKNNLSSVRSLVRMQDMPADAKRDLETRLGAMGAMHEHIYQRDQYAGVQAEEFIPAVVEEARKAYGSNVQIRYNIEPIQVDRDRATPLALLLSELATNAFKYAFPTGPGILDVSLHGVGVPDRAVLVFRDNGVGLPKSTPDSRKSMGMRLVKASVGQMDGTFEFTNDAGTVFRAELVVDPRGVL